MPDERQDDVRRELGTVRRRRAEAVRLEAGLAQRQAALEATLAELTGETSGDPARGDQNPRARPPRPHGPVASAGDLAEALHEWRRNIHSVNPQGMAVRRGRDHVRGDPAAPLAIVEYGDYQCTECAEAHEQYERLRPWVDEGRLCVVFRHFPLVDAHPLALRTAQAAEAAGAQGRFWELHEVLMEHVSDERRKGRVPVHGGARALDLDDAARRAGLDIERFHADIDDPVLLERILEDFRAGMADGVNGTPTFYVNGTRLDGGEAEGLYDQVVAAASPNDSGDLSPLSTQ